ncbi:LuxR C-terminal-related transcriptional regulator [Streptomyces sp. NPDC057101]|uniref:helix-turn-helix transcriptional regulator n=1 Tax=Streptomyces sp. NPDC057101 TaxID=3346020 RepID=UPI003637EAED
MATAALTRGPTEAERLLIDAEADADRPALPLQWACVHRTRTRLRSAHGEHAPALELFERAAQGFREGGLPVQHAWTLVTMAPTTLSVSGRAAALDVLARAEALARTCGAAWAAEESGPCPRATRRGHPAGRRPEAGFSPPAGGTSCTDAEDRSVDLRSALSERDRKVAELAAEGLRSRQIAERLFLSPRIVDSHLNSAYRKLGVSSRTALARTLGPAHPGQKPPDRS